MVKGQWEGQVVLHLCVLPSCESCENCPVKHTVSLWDDFHVLCQLEHIATAMHWIVLRSWPDHVVIATVGHRNLPF